MGAKMTAYVSTLHEYLSNETEETEIELTATSANFEPEPLRAPLPKSKPYPVEALGDVLGAAAKALHESVKAPLALCCQSVLASASLAAQAHFDVMLPWGERKPLSLFLLTVAESGERKSGVDDVVLGAAKNQERQDIEEYKQLLEKHEQDLETWDEAKKKSKDRAQKPSHCRPSGSHSI